MIYDLDHAIHIIVTDLARHRDEKLVVADFCGSVKAFNSRSAAASNILENAPERVIGVYDCTATAEQIRDDAEFVMGQLGEKAA